ncbi:MAG: tryptophan synthase subunit beta [Candidatus Omnitrophota bacterium]
MRKGYFGKFGGRFVPETLVPALSEVETAYRTIGQSREFKTRFNNLLANYAGRPTPLYHAQNISRRLNFKLYLKREDLLHSGAHKINNTLGQALLAKMMGKTRVIAETGAGQHGVATAVACALLDLKCAIFMGKVDIERQKSNVYRMRLCGAEVIPVQSGSQTLKDAINEALRDWVTNVRNTYYLFGTVAGPHPFPTIVRNLQSVIGRETRKQILRVEGRLPETLVACVGGGSNSIGLFYPFLRDPVKFIGVEAAGMGIASGKHAVTLGVGRPGVLHGTYSYLLQDKNGQIKIAHSVAPGLDYPGVGPEHSFYKENRRAKYVSVTDKEALSAFHLLSEVEGIIPALESSHSLAYLLKNKKKFAGQLVIMCLSGRGDKDLQEVLRVDRTPFTPAGRGLK